MQDHTNAQPAFHGTTVVSTRKDSAIEGAIVRRRQSADGTRFTTYEIDEAKAEMLLAIPNGLVRRHTAINPENIAKAIELSKAGTPRKEAEKALGVSGGTYRRLLEAGGVDVRRYTPVLTDENVQKALLATVKYDIRKRGDIIKASKEVGVDSRTLRRLLSKAFNDIPLEEIGKLRLAEQQRLATPEGQLELAEARKPLTRKSRKAKAADAQVPEAATPGNDASACTTPDAPAPVVETVAYTDGATATGVAPVPSVSPAQQAEAEAAVAEAEASAPEPAAVIPAGDVPVMDSAPTVDISEPPSVLSLPNVVDETPVPTPAPEQA